MLDDVAELTILHTGQHYDYDMDEIFFEDLHLRPADVKLEIGPCEPIIQISKMMAGLGKALSYRPDIVVVQGDTNTALAGALVGLKMGLPVAHVEAGCRSFNMVMPEEVNRILVDHASTILFAPDRDAFKNLVREGIHGSKVHTSGDTVIDACRRMNAIAHTQEFRERFGVSKNYVLVTVHRAENTDSKQNLQNIATALSEIGEFIEVVLPLHPRTKKSLARYDIELGKGVLQIEPLGYRLFISGLKGAKFVMTDSGGVQKEAGVLNVPCLLLRDETEWVELVRSGKNKLVGTESHRIIQEARILVEDSRTLERMKKKKSGLRSGASNRIMKLLCSSIP